MIKQRDTYITYCGTDIEELSKEDLIKAIEYLYDELQFYKEKFYNCGIPPIKIVPPNIECNI